MTATAHKPHDDRRAAADPADEHRAAVLDHGQAQHDPHQAHARDAQRRDGAADHVRAAVRVRVRRVDRHQRAARPTASSCCPGIQAQTIVFTAFVVSTGITADVEKGIIDRFRSLPIRRSAVLIGRSVASLMHSSIGVRGDGGDGAVHRLADPRRRRRGRTGVRADPGVRVRDDLVRHPDRLADAVGRGGQRRDVHRAVPDHVPGQHLCADRADAALAAGDRRVESGVVAGAGDAGAVGQRSARAAGGAAAAAPSGAGDDPVVAGDDGGLRAVRAARLRAPHRRTRRGSPRSSSRAGSVPA